MDTLAQALRGRPYIAGDGFSAADVYLGSMLNWYMRWDLIDKRPEFVAYCDGLITRPALLRAKEQANKLAGQQVWA